MISNWSKVGFLVSGVYAVVTIYHYWIKYNDVSQFILNMAISCLIAGVSWLYSKQLNQSNDILAIEDYLSNKKHETS